MLPEDENCESSALEYASVLFGATNVSLLAEREVIDDDFCIFGVLRYGSML